MGAGETMWGQARPRGGEPGEARPEWRQARPCGIVVTVFIWPKPKGGRTLPVLIDSDDPASIDSDPTLMD